MRLAIIGVGLIGGSFARAIRAAGMVDHIVGFDSDTASLKLAVELRVIDSYAASAGQVAQGADVVFLATPLSAMPPILNEIAHQLSPRSIVTDTGSVKATVIQVSRKALGTMFGRFVPGHPIAGKELSGVNHADSKLFHRKRCVVTPVDETEGDALTLVEQMWRAVGCTVERMTATEHDRIYASVSHLPHLLSFALLAHVAAKPDAAIQFSLAGPGFWDVVRLAASSPEMWSDICVANGKNIRDEVRGYRELLDDLVKAIDEADNLAVRRTFDQAIAARSLFTSRA